MALNPDQPQNFGNGVPYMGPFKPEFYNQPIQSRVSGNVTPLVQSFEPDLPVFANDADYQVYLAHNSAQPNVIGSPTKSRVPPGVTQLIPVDDSPGESIGPSITAGANTSAQDHATKMKAILDAIYPSDSAPTMQYGSPLDIRIPFINRHIRASGKTMDRLASAIAAAAQGMYVSPSDTGGQLLRGIVSGYGVARGSDYATRKAEYEKKKEEYQKNLEARRKLAGTLGVEQFKQEIKPAEEDNKSVIVTKQLILDARKAGKIIPEALLGQRVQTSQLIGEVKEPGVNYEALNLSLRKADLGMRQSNQWRDSQAFKNYAAALDLNRQLQEYAANPGPASDKQLVRILAKLQDATSAVMAGEEKNFTEASSFAEKWRAWADGMSGAGKFTAKDRATAIRLANKVLRTKRASFDEMRRNEQNNLARSGVDPSYIGDLSQISELVVGPEVKDASGVDWSTPKQ